MDDNEIVTSSVHETVMAPREAPIDFAHATPELFAALAEAQARVGSIGKDGHNAHGKYNYATADSMIRGGREARAGTGLSLLTTWTVRPLDLDDVPADAGQWPSAIVTLHWTLAHSSGGRISSSLAICAIESRQRPPDKAVAAAATYAEGFIERNLMRLDRAEPDRDDVDSREEKETAPARRPQAPRQQQRQRQERPPQTQPSNGTGESPALRELVECADADALQAWCRKYAVSAKRAGDRIVKKVVERGDAVGVSEEQTRTWLGISDADEEGAGA